MTPLLHRSEQKLPGRRNPKIAEEDSDLRSLSTVQGSKQTNLMANTAVSFNRAIPV